MDKCEACDLYVSCRTPCMQGVGDKDKAKLMLISDAPSFGDDQAGRPFTGSAGRLLDFILYNKLSVNPLDIYLTSIIKCRPPQGNLPSKKAELDELIEICWHNLEAEIAEVDPKAIVLFSNTAISLVNARFISKNEGMELDELYEGAKTIGCFSLMYVMKSPSKESNLARALHKACRLAGVKTKAKPLAESGIFNYDEECVEMI